MELNEFGFRSDPKIIDVIQSEAFTISAEVIPPRNGAEQQKILSQIEALVSGGAEFLSVTKGAGGSLRGGSLPIAQAIKERFSLPAIAHFTCRDLSPQEVENQLMDHHYFGVTNILALRGDPPTDQPNWNAHEHAFQYAYQVIEQIRKMNEGIFLERASDRKEDIKKATDFCIGAAVYPEHPHEAERFEFFKRKVDAGAEYGITQMLFDADLYSEFLEIASKKSISAPVLPGSLILKSKTQAHALSKRFNVKVSDKILKKLPEKRPEGSIEYAVDLFLDYVEDLKRAGAPGVHLFVLSDTNGCRSALEKLSKTESTQETKS